jgi:hypothetical protein
MQGPDGRLRPLHAIKRRTSFSLRDVRISTDFCTNLQVYYCTLLKLPEADQNCLRCVENRAYNISPVNCRFFRAKPAVIAVLIKVAL